MAKAFSTTAFSGALVLSTVGSAQAVNLISNGDFEAVDISGNYTTYNSTNVPDGFGWSISDDFVYLVNSFWSGVSGTTNPDDFDQSLELRPNVNLSQSFDTQIGRTYELSFFYAHDFSNAQGRALGHFDIVGTGSLLSETLLHDIPSTQADLNFLQYTEQFVADSESTTLTFSGDPSNGLHGFVIDGVLISEVYQDATNSIPEPSSVTGLLGLIGFGFRALQRKRSC
ncbi:MAG: DUF642 domain-containing protein [Symploca sp. SIO1A3]|nr:DUF642 domain-containing protein [Symploca sp. SIO2C1]NER50363.1 DUF642 domain-containing protein [Symploca sp. SIO1A3]